VTILFLCWSQRTIL